MIFPIFYLSSYIKIKMLGILNAKGMAMAAPDFFVWVGQAGATDLKGGPVA